MSNFRNVVRSALRSHSWLGLALGGVMLITCLSGTVAVFYEELERWEQPLADEYSTLDPALMERAFNEYVDTLDSVTEHLYLVFPSAAIPRVKVADEQHGRYVNADGSLGAKARDRASAFITGLHIYLHLPVNLGIVIVSGLGALLCGLIITGFLAHPSLVSDAFKLRRSSKQIEQVDLHNRLGVWAAPFHLIIAMTGSYYGFVIIMVAVLAALRGDPSAQSLSEEIFPSEPELTQQAPDYQIAKALTALEALSPEGTPLYMLVHDANKESRFMEFYVQQPGLLAWSENYRFDTAGNFIDIAGYTTTSTAQQLMYSVYRIHFGNFAGVGTKLLYVILGLSLTIVSATGMNIWLAKRSFRDPLNLLWPAFVWGTPLAMTLALIASLIDAPTTPTFWGALLLCLLIAARAEHESAVRQGLRLANAAALGLTVAVYGFKFQTFSAGGALTINLTLLALAGAFLLAFACNRPQRSVAQHSSIRETISAP